MLQDQWLPPLPQTKIIITQSIFIRFSSSRGHYLRQKNTFTAVSSSPIKKSFFSTSSYPLKNSAGTFGLEWKVVLQPYSHTLLTSSHTFPIWFPLFSWGYSIIYPIFPGLQGHQESPPTEPSQSGSHHRRGHIMWPPQHSHNMWPPCTATT